MDASDYLSKIKPLDELTAVCAALKSQGKRIALCHGVFDLLHPGHIRHFAAAKKFGDVLVVSLTRDEFVNKGPGRPAFTQDLRAETLAALEAIDYVTLNEPVASALPVIDRIRPDFYVKGVEYKEQAGGFTGNRKLEKEAVESHGGQMVFTDDIVFSSTKLLNNHFSVYPEDAQIYLRDFRNRWTPDAVIAHLDKLKDMKVLVIGDATIDEYHYTKPLGKSGKENLVVSKFENAETMAGGVFVLANHVASFCGQVTMVSCLGSQDSREAFVRERLAPNVIPKFFYRDDAVTTVKRRFLDSAFLNKLFEVYYFDDKPLAEEIEQQVWRYLSEELPKYDCVIVLDYAHGFLSDNLINLICGLAPFLAVNTQTNAANTGFNLITKYPRTDYVCISEPELRLAMRDRHGNLEMLVRRVSELLGAQRVMVTRGNRGSVSYSPEQGVCTTPVLSQKVLDRVGAGDALLGLTAPLVAAGTPLELVGFLGGVAGAAAVTIVGNRTAIQRKDIARSVKTMLS